MSPVMPKILKAIQQHLAIDGARKSVQADDPLSVARKVTRAIFFNVKFGI
jgi:hypothetical protein